MKKIINNRMKKLLEERKNYLVGYFLLGYPDKDEFVNILKSIDSTELDILEIGFPSLNPYSDGTVIKEAHSKVDISVSRDLEYFKKVRKTTDKPIWLMAYEEDFIKSNIYKLLAEEKLIDVLVIPDCTFKKRKELAEEMYHYDIDVVGFIRPDMSENELELVLNNFSLIYAQLHTGKTGVSKTEDNFDFMIEIAKKYDDTTVFAGFGINNKKRVTELFDKGFDGTIIGTEMVKRLNDSKENLIDFINHVKRAKDIKE